MHPVPKPRSGVTLLELMLALALTGVVIVAIGMAIDLNLRTLDSRRAEIERAQLAQAVLRHIAMDLQNAVIYEPLDMSKVPQMASEGDVMGLAEDAGMSDPLDEAGLLDESGLGLDDTLSENTLDIANTVAPTSEPGLFGNQYELQVDVSHLPRVDQYERMFAGATESVVADIPSDVKTVAYYLNSGIVDSAGAGVAGVDSTAGSAMTAMAGMTGTGGSGLVRRAMDRAVTAWASQSGSLDTQVTYGDLLAPEVNYLEFRYFDGTQWLTEWDSATLGGLPVAVEITIGIDPAYGLDQASADVAQMRELSMSDMTEYMFRLVVRIPTAKPLPLDEEFLEMGLLEGVGL
jgi:hypothetical protein